MLAGYLHEVTAFPNGKHDDQVDSTARHGQGGWYLSASQALELGLVAGLV
jgi:phage terminase large subunit-like protein